MFYPEDFKKRVKETYPNIAQLHKLLDEGSDFVGRYLDDASTPSLPLDTILSATSLEELKAIAMDAKKKVDLYIEWFNLKHS